MQTFLKKPARFVQIFIALVASCSFSNIHGQGFSEQTQTRLQFVIDSFQNNPANPYVGGIAAAIKVDGLAFWQGATGYAARNVDGNNNLLPGGSAFTTSTLSRMYSVTKTFTATLVLELAKAGVFSLDHPVSNFMPLNVINPTLNPSVTIKQLLAHESGYSDYVTEQMLQIVLAIQPTHVWTVYEMLTFVHQVSAPGSQRSYSSTNYLVLGAIIETVTGKPVEQHYRERFFQPLDLQSIYMGHREAQPSGTVLAAPHDNLSPFNPIFQMTGQSTFPNAYTNASAFPMTGIISLAFTGGALVSNVSDLAEWGNLLYNGRATSEGVLEQMRQSISSTPDEDGDFLGYGIMRTTKISTSDIFIGHDGNAPGYRSLMFYQPERKMTIAILTNYAGARVYDLARALFQSIPSFLCGNENRKEDKIIVCFNDNNLCVDRTAAGELIGKGGYLGRCAPVSNTNSINSKLPEVEIQSTQSGILRTYPNPFRGTLNVMFAPEKTGKYQIRILDMNGRVISTLFDNIAQKGSIKRFEWDAGRLAAGTFVIALQTLKEIQTRKITLIRE
ncbi:MAG TPA: serine hydrolase [Chitinophagaceae bacterium]